MLSFEAKMNPNSRKAQINDIIRSSSSIKRHKPWWRNVPIKCTWIIYKERSGLNLVIPRATPQLNPAMVASAYPTSNPSCTEIFLPASTPSLYPSFLLSRTKPQRQFHLLDTIYRKQIPSELPSNKQNPSHRPTAKRCELAHHPHPHQFHKLLRQYLSWVYLSTVRVSTCCNLELQYRVKTWSYEHFRKSTHNSGIQCGIDSAELAIHGLNLMLCEVHFDLQNLLHRLNPTHCHRNPSLLLKGLRGPVQSVKVQNHITHAQDGQVFQPINHHGAQQSIETGENSLKIAVIWNHHNYPQYPERWKAEKNEKRNSTWSLSTS